ncbi:Carboxylate--amine ligase, partial [Dysosmobacter welbionis]
PAPSDGGPVHPDCQPLYQRRPRRIRRQQRQCQKPAGCALPVHRSGDADHDHRRRSGCRRGAGCAGAVPCRGVSLWSRPDLLNQRGAAGKAGGPSLQKCAGTGQ